MTYTVDECPEGYPRLAAFKTSDHNFMIYRSFSYLHARCLLYTQDEIVCLERQLDRLDDNDDGNVDPKIRKRLKSRVADDWEEGERVKLVRKIRGRLGEYGELNSLTALI